MLFPGGHAASICDNTPEAICRVLEEEEYLTHIVLSVFLRITLLLTWSVSCLNVAFIYLKQVISDIQGGIITPTQIMFTTLVW